MRQRMVPIGSGFEMEAQELLAPRLAGGSSNVLGKSASLIGLIGTHMCAFTLSSLMYYTMRSLYFPGQPIAWASFMLHPLMMTVAFGLLAPLGLSAYAGYERILNMSHSRAKSTHAVLMAAAAVLGFLGILDMWLVHSNAAAAQEANGWPVHFQSAHSCLGAAAFLAFLLQWGGGAALFLNGSARPALKAAMMPLHVLLGSFAAFGTLASVVTGVLSLVGNQGRGVEPKFANLRLVSMLAFLLAGFQALTLAAKRGRDH